MHYAWDTNELFFNFSSFLNFYIFSLGWATPFYTGVQAPSSRILIPSVMTDDYVLHFHYLPFPSFLFRLSSVFFSFLFLSLPFYPFYFRLLSFTDSFLPFFLPAFDAMFPWNFNTLIIKDSEHEIFPFSIHLLFFRFSFRIFDTRNSSHIPSNSLHPHSSVSAFRF